MGYQQQWQSQFQKLPHSSCLLQLFSYTLNQIAEKTASLREEEE